MSGHTTVQTLQRCTRIFETDTLFDTLHGPSSTFRYASGATELMTEVLGLSVENFAQTGMSLHQKTHTPDHRGLELKNAEHVGQRTQRPDTKKEKESS